MMERLCPALNYKGYCQNPQCAAVSYCRNQLGNTVSPLPWAPVMRIPPGHPVHVERAIHNENMQAIRAQPTR